MSKVTDFIDYVIKELECEKKIQECFSELSCIPPEDINSYIRIKHLLEFRGAEAELMAKMVEEEKQRKKQKKHKEDDA